MPSKLPKNQSSRPPITAAEFRLLESLWQLGRASVADIERAIKRKLAYTTILTVLRSLEKKGFVTHDTEGRTFVYSPTVDRKRAQSGVLQHLTRAFFNGSPDALMLHLVDETGRDAKTRARLRELLELEESER